MPTEIRHILFRKGEVVAAITAYRRRAQLPLPSGSVLSCCLEPDAAGTSVCARLTIDADPPIRGGPQVRHEVALEGAELAAALILFCRDARIPLPSTAQKTLSIHGSQLAMIVVRKARVEDDQAGQSAPVHGAAAR